MSSFVLWALQQCLTLAAIGLWPVDTYAVSCPARFPPLSLEVLEMSKFQHYPFQHLSSHSHSIYEKLTILPSSAEGLI